MHNIKIYLDTSFISHLEQEDAPEKMSETNELWLLLGLRSTIELIISSLAVKELMKCSLEKVNVLQQRIVENRLTFINETNDDIVLARNYLQSNILTNKSFTDLRHIAIAVNNKCSYILSWNFKHFVNPKTIHSVNAYNATHDLRNIQIISPSMMLGGL